MRAHSHACVHHERNLPLTKPPLDETSPCFHARQCTPRARSPPPLPGTIFLATDSAKIAQQAVSSPTEGFDVVALQAWEAREVWGVLEAWEVWGVLEAWEAWEVWGVLEAWEVWGVLEAWEAREV